MTNDNALKAAAAAYISANPAPFTNHLSEAGEDLMEAVLQHRDVKRIVKRIGARADDASWCRIERNKRVGDGKGLRVQLGLPIVLNHEFPDGDVEMGMVAEIEVLIADPTHPYYPGDIWSIKANVELCDMEHWPDFEHWEVILPEPKLPAPVCI